MAKVETVPCQGAAKGDNMISNWADVTVRDLLDASLVLAQVLVVNWLGMPFAAITLFAGVAAYAVALALQFGFVASGVTLGLAGLMLIAFIGLVDVLPQDSYLLVTLAALGFTGALASGSKTLGGQLGMSSVSKLLAAQDPQPFLFCAVPIFLLAFGAVWILGRSQLGMASNLARLARLNKQAVPLVPMKSLTKLLLSVAFILAVSSGALQGLYTGRVDPNIFRIENAIPVLVATLASGRNHWRAAVVAVGFFVFPDLFADLIGYQRSALAQCREIALGVFIMIIAGRQWAQAEARH